MSAFNYIQCLHTMSIYNVYLQYLPVIFTYRVHVYVYMSMQRRHTLIPCLHANCTCNVPTHMHAWNCTYTPGTHTTTQPPAAMTPPHHPPRD